MLAWIMPVFSLIIPVYNVEAYLTECLDSCVNQTFEDIEIICINDCSPDNSGIILESYAKKDSRIKIINHSENKGLGAARNTGIDAANGDYCWFIDSDDYILLNACEILNDVIAEFRVDVIRFNRIDYDINTGEKKILPQKRYSWEPYKVFTKKDHVRLGLPEVSACMYITSIMLLRTLKFCEGVIHEDNDFTPILFSKAESIYYVSYSLYCVRRRMGSITRDYAGISEKHIFDKLFAVNTLFNYIRTEKLSERHFCSGRMIFLFEYAQKEYNEQPNLHTPKLNNAIKEATVLLKPFMMAKPRYRENMIKKIVIYILPYGFYKAWQLLRKRWVSI